MPQLPVYEARGNIQARTSAPLRNEAGASFEQDRQVLGTLQNITQQWQDANDVMQYTEAKANFGVAVADIQTRAYQDPDYKNAEKYNKELIQARKNSLMGISNQQIAGRIGTEFDYETEVAQIKMGAQFKQKQIAHNQVMVKTNLDTLLQNKLTAATPAESEQYNLKIQELLTLNVGTGVLSPEEAGEILKKSAYESAENMVYADPDFAIQKLESENLGFDERTKNKLIGEAQQLIKKREDLAEWQLQQNQTQATIGLSEALSNNTLSPQMVRKMQQEGVIDTETAAIFDSIALKKTYEVPEATSLGEPDYFLRLLDDSMGDKRQIKKIMGDAARAYGDHKIGTNQYLYFIQNAKETFERQGRGEFTKSSGQNKFQGAIEGIKSFFTGKDKEQKEALNEFTDRAKPGEDPNKAKDEVLNEYRVKAKPEIISHPETGKMMVDKNGNRAIVYPDGRVEEVK